MGYDAFAPLSSAHINVLCIPASKITKNKFQGYVKALQSCDSVRLKGVPGPANFSKFAEGTVLLNVSSEAGLDGSPDFYPLETNREPQIILGIIDGQILHELSTGDYQASLEHISSVLQKDMRPFSRAIFRTTLVFGGPSPDGVTDCLWTSLDGQRPDLTDVAVQLVDMLYQRLPAVLEGMRNQVLDLPQQLRTTKRDTMPSASNGRGSMSNSDAPTASPVEHRVASNQGNETAGRQSIMQGLMSLQVGQWPDALQYLSEGATRARNIGDYLWHAKALEGLVVTILLSIHNRVLFSVPPICFPPHESSQLIYPESAKTIISANRASSILFFSTTSDNPIHTFIELLPHIVGTILGLYERVSHTLGSIGHCVIACEARVRWVNLLIAVRKAGGNVDDVALGYLLGDLVAAQSRSAQETPGPRLKLYSSVLSEMLIEAALQAQERLHVQQSSIIHMSIARSLSLLSNDRKQGFYLKDFLQRLAPALVQARKTGAAEVGIHPATNIPAFRSTGLLSSEGIGTGVRAVLESIVRIYGLHITQNNINSSPRERLQQALQFWVSMQAAGDLFMKLEILTICIDVCESLPDFEGSLTFASWLLQSAKSTLSISKRSSELLPRISPADQSRLLQNIKRAIGAAEKLGEPGLRAHYWDKFLVRDLSLAIDADSGRLIPHTADVLSMAQDNDGETRRDPFIFNPFAKSKMLKHQEVLVVGERAIFNVMLQNPLDVDVEVEKILLSTEGCSFEALEHSVVLGGLSSQIFTLSGIPRETGTLRINGCRATVQGCHEEEYLILPDGWRILPNDKIRSNARSHGPAPDIVLPQAKELTLEVINPLPHLTVVASSLIRPSIMLLEGESMRLELVLHNDSDIDIDFGALTSEDSVTKKLEEALTNKDILPPDLHEVQYQIASRPVISLKNEEANLGVPARGYANFVFEIFGKPGLTDVSVLIDYTYLGKSRSEVKETFFTRQLTYTVATTINGSIDIARCVVVPLQQDFNSSIESFDKLEGSQSQLFATSKSNLDVEKNCLLLLDLRNIWPQPLEINIRSCRDQGETIDAVSAVLLPGQITRLAIIVTRILVKDSYAVVPSLDSKRQFVVSGSKLPVDQEAASRESFWYRERLLELVTARWSEQDSLRHGQLDLRKGLRLNARSIDALKVDQVDLSFSLGLESPSSVEDTSLRRLGSSHYRLHKCTFAVLTVKIHNRSQQELSLLVRIQPCLRDQPHNVALDLSRKFAWSGNLQRALYPRLLVGETRSIDLGIVALATGDFEVNGTAEEIKGHLPRVEAQAPDAGASSERRIWHARHPCLIDAVDS